MIRSLLALISGVLSSFLLLSVIGFIIMNFKIYPFYDFVNAAVTGDEKKFFNLGEQVLYTSIFVIFPIISFTTGFVIGMIAKHREYLIGTVSIIPLFVIFYIYSFSINSIYAFISFMISVVFGVFISKVLKKRKE